MDYSWLKLGSGLIFILGVFHLGIAQSDEKFEPMTLSNEKQSDCIPISIIEPTNHKPRNFVIYTPGHYCLMEDLTFAYNPLNPFELLAGGNGKFGSIAPGTELDLRGHTLRSNLNGVSGLSTEGDRSGSSKPTTIKNGKIVLSGMDAIKAQNTYHYLYYDKPFKILDSNASGTSHLYQAARDGYISTRITLENLDITAGENAIFLEGNDNIIRNCKIRVKPGANAIQIFGNNVQILNNEIIVEANYKYIAGKMGWTKEMQLSMAPIMVRDGDNSLISGNTITLKDTEENRPVQAISLRDSRNVRIENNQIIGAQTIYKAFTFAPSYEGRTNDNSPITPLMLAAGNDTPHEIKLQIAKGIDIHAKNIYGTDALMYAVLAGKSENIKFLLAAGANVNSQDDAGNTALSLARQQGRKEVIDLLVAAGAKEKSSPPQKFIGAKIIPAGYDSTVTESNNSLKAKAGWID